MAYLLPILFALFVWWFTTGVVVYLDGLPRHTFRWSMAGATALLAAASYGLYITGNDASVAGAFTAFACAIMVWGWLEMSFLMGFITGPRTSPLPLGAKGWRRFQFALQTLLYHELAIIVGVVFVMALTLGGDNQTGVWTFVVLWLMRLSAKLNVFFGVPNLSEEFLPAHLDYLKSYFRRAPMNLFFPLSVTAATVMTVVLTSAAVAPGASEFDIAALMLVTTLLALAVLEHWLMVVPLPAAALWGWGLKSHEGPSAKPVAISSTC